ncbi:MAG: hypothetical protein Q7T94_12760 [Rugosibacter sp.]|nr:hypothetical protein [Rugosibacter sp.]
MYSSNSNAWGDGMLRKFMLVMLFVLFVLFVLFGNLADAAQN